MVVKWDNDADQTLLVIALGVHKLPLNYEAIAAAWPKDSRHGTPTPRAISERIIKLRKKFAQVAGDSSPRKQISQANQIGQTVHRRGRGTRSMCPSPTPTKVENMARARSRWADDSDDEVEMKDEIEKEVKEEVKEQAKVKQELDLELDSDIEIVSPP
ncbi:hypothetical protein KEM56_003048 [Ascosphaera pollenicola]|nr:hypothetical protein KEM56_003048 [Ascosphaera pollenicola]